MVIVTGGAGFIGSCLVRLLNDMGEKDIVIVDNIACTEKWKNLTNKIYTEYINKDDFINRLDEFANGIDLIIHMGACSATTEKDFDYLYNNNFEFTKTLWKYCADNDIRFIYASSAATYGDGNNGFFDTKDSEIYRPLNGYGYSKQLFDLWVEKEIIAGRKTPKQHVGFKFFNVYGPNEYFKGSMASVVFHTFNEVKATGKKGLFKSYNSDYEEGEQLRDFIYVKDICSVIKYMIEHEYINGLFNLGTGIPRSFNDLAKATFSAMGLEPNIEYIDMPEELREKYQYYTKAEMGKLRGVGYTRDFYTLEEGIDDYVKNYLDKNYEIY